MTDGHQLDGDAVRRRQRCSKARERLWARILGGDRWINDGSAHSDGNDAVPVSLEVTQTVHPEKTSVWRDKWHQALRNSASESKPPVVVISSPGQRWKKDIVICTGDVFERAWRGGFAKGAK